MGSFMRTGEYGAGSQQSENGRWISVKADLMTGDFHDPHGFNGFHTSWSVTGSGWELVFSPKPSEYGRCRRETDRPGAPLAPEERFTPEVFYAR